MTTDQMEKRAAQLKAEWDKLDLLATELYNNGDESQANIDRYNELSFLANDALDEWLEAEAALFERWDYEAANPKAVRK